MPLRDHFHPPTDRRVSWSGFHAMWPSMMVQRLIQILPEGYIAEPEHKAGAPYQVDVGTLEQENWTEHGYDTDAAEGGTATAVRTLAEPTLTAETNLLEQPVYAVRVFDEHQARRLVAVIELVSPANKDRPESRQAFVTKCSAFLQNGISVVVIDPVTNKQFNLYAELLVSLGIDPPAVAGGANALYAVSCRVRRRPPKRMTLDAWASDLTLGEPLPALPLWLNDETWVPLDLEGSYEDACRAFRLPPVD